MYHQIRENIAKEKAPVLPEAFFHTNKPNQIKIAMLVRALATFRLEDSIAC